MLNSQGKLVLTKDGIDSVPNPKSEKKKKVVTSSMPYKQILLTYVKYS